MLRIDLTGTDHCQLYLNGRLVAEVAAGLADTRDDLMARVVRARTLGALPGILRGIVETLSRSSAVHAVVRSTGRRRRRGWN